MSDYHFADPPKIVKRRKGLRIVAPRPPVAEHNRSRKPNRKPEPDFKHRYTPRDEQARVTERRAIALAMRKGGATYRAIAAKLGVNVRTAFDYVQAELVALRETTIADAHSLRTLELERCDDLYAHLQRRIAKGDPFAISVALKVLERRAKLLGIDVPEKMEFIGALTAVSAEQIAKMSDTEIADRLKDMMLRLAKSVPPQLRLDVPARPVIDVPAIPETAGAT